MSITSAELILYGAADKVEDDVSTVGGAIDTTSYPTFTQFTTGGGNPYVLSVKSSNAGDTTQTLTVEGRDATGAYVTDTTVTVNGVTEESTVQLFERILKITVSATCAGTLTFYQSTGTGTPIGTLPPGGLILYAAFINAFSTTSPETRWEKFFWANTDGSLTLTSAAVTLTADPSSVTMMGLATAVNDSGTAANRLTAPAGVSFVGVSTAQSVPGGGNLAAGAGIGMWIEQALLANNAALRSTYTSQLGGNTT